MIIFLIFSWASASLNLVNTTDTLTFYDFTTQQELATLQLFSFDDSKAYFDPSFHSQNSSLCDFSNETYSDPQFYLTCPAQNPVILLLSLKHSVEILPDLASFPMNVIGVVLIIDQEVLFLHVKASTSLKFLTLGFAPDLE